MMEEIRKRIKKALEGLGKGKATLLLFLTLAGILLLLFGGGKTEKTPPPLTGEEEMARFAAYEKALTEEVKTLVASVAGVGDVSIKISFSEGFQMLYEEDERGKPVILREGGGERAVVKGISPPAVSGVGIVCRGGHDEGRRAAVTELVATALGIPMNRVFVTGK